MFSDKSNLGKGVSVNEVQNWGEKEVKELDRQMSSGGMKITGRHFEYTVSEDERGNLEVQVSKTPWYASQAMRERAEGRADRLFQALVKNTALQAHNQSVLAFKIEQIQKHRTRPVQNRLRSMLPQQNPEVAVYGKGSRSNTKIAVAFKHNDQRVNVTTIDSYNSEAFGLDARTPATDLLGVSKKARRGQLTQFTRQRLQHERVFLKPERLTAWASYVEKNVDRIDVMGKVRRLDQLDQQEAVKSNGKTGNRLARFVLKNLSGGVIRNDPNFNQQGWENATPEERFQQIKNLVVFKEIQEIAQKDGREERIDKLSSGAEQFLQTAFFRQTSKMGLEFFASQGIPVVFELAEMGKHKAVSYPFIQAKPWRKGELREGFHEPITYSEMRHVDRLCSDLEYLTNKHRHLQANPKGVSVLPVMAGIDRDTQVPFVKSEPTTIFPNQLDS